ncbi:hydroxyisourate hydrolase [Cellulomonas sp. URHB0016]
MSAVTTHVLDAAHGRPAVGVAVRLLAATGDVLATGATDADGRVRELGPEELPPGEYRLELDTGGWFAVQGTAAFYPRVLIDFTVTDPAAHHHVPLLLSPFAYSTYRGS